MYQKILVAYDGSEYSDVALRQAASLARLCGAELHLVGIVATLPYAAMDPAVGGVYFWGQERQTIEEAMEKALRTLSGEGLTPTTSIRDGHPATEISGCAIELNADLVVIGHSDKGVLERWFEGSVGAALLRDLPRNLLIVSG